MRGEVIVWIASCMLIVIFVFWYSKAAHNTDEYTQIIIPTESSGSVLKVRP
jgi:hypothetical protein